jgi:leucyl-tRNA synthetase
VLVTSERAARGMAYQGLLKEWGKAPCLIHLKGVDLLGLPLKAPQAIYETVYTLPLLTISMSKGTVRHIVIIILLQIHSYNNFPLYF